MESLRRKRDRVVDFANALFLPFQAHVKTHSKTKLNHKNGDPYRKFANVAFFWPEHPLMTSFKNGFLDPNFCYAA